LRRGGGVWPERRTAAELGLWGGAGASEANGEVVEEARRWRRRGGGRPGGGVGGGVEEGRRTIGDEDLVVKKSEQGSTFYTPEAFSTG